jgi:hypothetical protein
MPADRVDYHAALLRLYGFPQPKAGLRVLTLLRKEKVGGVSRGYSSSQAMGRLYGFSCFLVADAALLKCQGTLSNQ